mgnify:CR=1 FL=1
MSRISAYKNGILFEMRDELVFVEPYGPDCVRVRATRNAQLSEEKWTLLDAEACETRIIMESEDRSYLCNGKLKVEVSRVHPWHKCCILTFCRDGKAVLRTREEYDPATRYLHVEGNNYRTRIVFEAREDEHIYGLGQEQQDFFNRKGCTYDLMHWNTKSTLPIVYSSLGYGFLWNNPAIGTVEFGRNHTVWQAESCYQADYLVFVGDTPAELVNKYAHLTGFCPPMPEWAAGFWQCRLRYESQDDLMEVARRYYEMKIPVNAIVIDFFHWTQQGNWDFDPKYWPDPQKMCEELEEMGIRPVVSIWPTAHPKSHNFEKMNEEKMLVRTENGSYGLFDFCGQVTFIDPTNPKTREFVWEQAKKGYYRYGIKTFWLDEAEPDVHPQQFGNLSFYIGNGSQVGLLYPYYYAKAYYDGLKGEGETEIVSLTRAAYPGSQRFGAIVWNGDIPSTFDSLRQSIVSGLSMSLCGIPWWNSDIGGFYGGDIESDYFRELIVRWFQFGLFCPVMRLHGSRNRPKDYVPRHPGVYEPSGGDNEIWSFGEKNFPILRGLILLRAKLKPYILECAERTSRTGEPVMRPMFFDFPDDANCLDLSDQYMFGPDILFAPITTQGQTERSVYLPKGEWIRTLDKKVYEGGRWIIVAAAIDEYIAFVRKGADIIRLWEES